MKAPHPQPDTLLELLNRCAAACDHCAVACLQENDVHMLSRCISLDMDCASICQVAASLVARQSENLDAILDACAKVCEACAEECGKHSHMEHCRQCAEACAACADACNTRM